MFTGRGRDPHDHDRPDHRSSICRELFLQVPNELEEGALALGATRWEMVRGVILPSLDLGSPLR